MKKKELAARLVALEHAHQIDCDEGCNAYERHLEDQIAAANREVDRLKAENAGLRAALVRPVIVQPTVVPPYGVRPYYPPTYPTVTYTLGSTVASGTAASLPSINGEKAS